MDRQRWVLAVGLAVALTGTGAAHGQDSLGAGLVGHTATLCGPPRGQWAFTVDHAEVTPTEDGALRVVVLLRATNQGAEPAAPIFAGSLFDERGRRFSAEEGGAALRLATERGLASSYEPVQPGFTVQTVWPFRVAPDAQALTLGQTPTWACR
jgi:hypothetical protein